MLGEGGWYLLAWWVLFLVIFFALLLGLFIISHFRFLLKILIIFIKILRLIRPFTGLHLLFLLNSQLFLLVKHLIFRMGIPRFVIHRIVHIDTLMVEQLSEGNHCRVLKVFAKTSCNEVGLDPFYVLQRVCLLVKQLRVLFTYRCKLLTLFFKILSLLLNPQHHPPILHPI